MMATEKVRSCESDIESLRHQVMTVEQQLASSRHSGEALQQDLNAVQAKHLEALNAINEMENKCMGMEHRVEQLREQVCPLTTTTTTLSYLYFLCDNS